MENNFQHYIDIFPSSSKEKKLDLIGKIAIEKNVNSLQFFISCLSDEYWPVRKASSEVIKSFGEIAIPALSAAMNSYNADIQFWAVQILSELGPKGFPTILRALPVA